VKAIQQIIVRNQQTPGYQRRKINTANSANRFVLEVQRGTAPLLPAPFCGSILELEVGAAVVAGRRLGLVNVAREVVDAPVIVVVTLGERATGGGAGDMVGLGTPVVYART
jgi:hypothetical protein